MIHEVFFNHSYDPTVLAAAAQLNPHRTCNRVAQQFNLAINSITNFLYIDKFFPTEKMVIGELVKFLKIQDISFDITFQIVRIVQAVHIFLYPKVKDCAWIKAQINNSPGGLDFSLAETKILKENFNVLNNLLHEHNSERKHFKTETFIHNGIDNLIVYKTQQLARIIVEKEARLKTFTQTLKAKSKLPKRIELRRRPLPSIKVEAKIFRDYLTEMDKRTTSNIFYKAYSAASRCIESFNSYFDSLEDEVNLSRGELEIINSQFLKIRKNDPTNKAGRKNALVLVATADHNNAFNWGNVQKNTLLKMSEKYFIEFYRISTVADMEARIGCAGKNKPIDLLWLMGHGEPNRIWLGGSDNPLRFEDVRRTTCFNYMAKHGKIVLYSCSTGKPTPEGNMATEIAKKARQCTIFAPSDDAPAFICSLAPFTVRYRSFTKQYNSQLGIEEHKLDTRIRDITRAFKANLDEESKWVWSCEDLIIAHMKNDYKSSSTRHFISLETYLNVRNSFG